MQALAAWNGQLFIIPCLLQMVQHVVDAFFRDLQVELVMDQPSHRVLDLFRHLVGQVFLVREIFQISNALLQVLLAVVHGDTCRASQHSGNYENNGSKDRHTSTVMHTRMMINRVLLEIFMGQSSDRVRLPCYSTCGRTCYL